MRKLLALGYQVTCSQKAKVDSQLVVWEECLMAVHPPWLAKRARRGLAQRLERAELALLALTPRRGWGKRQ